MQFTSFEFAMFFPIVVLLYAVIPKKARTLWLLLASYFFYMGWSVTYAFLILVSTLITYVCGLAIAHWQTKEDRRKCMLALAVGVLSNLGILFYFKYYFFFHDTAAALGGLFGLSIPESRLQIVLPVGISFYTFQALGYMIDVYRKDITAEKNLFRYALFVSFFPQLVAGPIERSGHLLTQLQELPHRKLWNFDKVTRGLLMLLWGYFMKLVIADRAAVLVDTVFENYYLCGGAALLVGMALFGIQLYCDFASYSAIAIGAAGILGIELMPNFCAPFLSHSISEFWRRWHVSLSSWLRDYVYIPLGGNRGGKLRQYRNTMITFIVSGLWHGASWNFVLWGALQGIFITVGNLLRPLREACHEHLHVKTQSFGYRMLQVAGTWLLFLVSFTFFRAPTIRDGCYYLQRAVMHFDIWSFFDGSLLYLGLDAKEMWVLGISIAILAIVDFYYQKKKAFFDTLVKNQGIVVQYMIAIGLLLFLLVYGRYGEGYEAAQFIYFQF